MPAVARQNLVPVAWAPASQAALIELVACTYTGDTGSDAAAGKRPDRRLREAGLIHTGLAKQLGLQRVISIDPIARRRDRATRFGDDLVLEPDPDTAGQVRASRQPRLRRENRWRSATRPRRCPEGLRRRCRIVAATGQPHRHPRCMTFVQNPERTGVAAGVRPGSAYMYPAYDLNDSYEDTDVYVSMAKLKNHDTCGITLSCKNVFGTLPASIYGDDSGIDEPNEKPRKRPFEGSDTKACAAGEIGAQELHFGVNHDPGYRVPHIVADIVAARPIHLAIIDGAETIAGGEGPWIRNVRPVRPGVLIAGLNPVCTDAVAAAAMGYNPRAERGTAPFQKCDNILRWRKPTASARRT